MKAPNRLYSEGRAHRGKPCLGGIRSGACAGGNWHRSWFFESSRLLGCFECLNLPTVVLRRLIEVAVRSLDEALDGCLACGNHFSHLLPSVLRRRLRHVVRLSSNSPAEPDPRLIAFAYPSSDRQRCRQGRARTQAGRGGRFGPGP